MFNFIFTFFGSQLRIYLAFLLQWTIFILGLTTFHKIRHPIDHFELLLFFKVAKHRDNFDNILIDELSNLVDNFGQQLLFDEYLPFVGRQVYIIGVPWQKDVDDINIFG